ncbi:MULTISPECIES: hypothetical protein [Pseudomonas]|uniref:hypothetical protein n=1 Tax=Pseudomonas TaxID=286 RepID=UPI0004D7E7CE|nr:MULTISPECIES: hypothetical protein [Pseudomonas]KES20141.1 hypothetical protein FG99_00090 [Pseudomonas sp. AAC]MBH3433674.1 hypothetical protein [Pseudomonas citronellolis]OHS11595.1 hypothetical protein HMPREF3289_08610 [Pseudomonas sp. HMSC75E02]
MTLYARIQDGKVFELFETDGDMAEVFHPALKWVEVPDEAEVFQDWLWSEEKGFMPPEPDNQA